MIATTQSSSRRKNKRAMQCRAFLDGRDVSSLCVYADSRRGVVRLHRLNDQGSRYVDLDTGGIAMETRYGRVKILRRRVRR